MSLKCQDQNDCALAYKTLSCHHAVSYINLSLMQGGDYCICMGGRGILGGHGNFY